MTPANPTTTPDPTSALPKGIFYETARKRFRVRLYKFGRVVYQTYHRYLAEALASLDRGMGRRVHLERDTTKKQGACVTSILAGLMPKSPELNFIE